MNAPVPTLSLYSSPPVIPACAWDPTTWLGSWLPLSRGPWKRLQGWVLAVPSLALDTDGPRVRTELCSSLLCDWVSQPF